MNWFVNLSIRAKLFMGFGLMIVLLALVTVEAYRGITTIRQDQIRLFDENFANVTRAMDVRFNQTKIRANSMTELLSLARSEIESSMTENDSRSKTVDGIMRDLTENEKDNPLRLQQIMELDAIRKAFNETRDREVVPLILSGKMEEAKKVVLGVQAERNRKINTIVDDLVNAEQKDAQASLLKSLRIANQTITLFAIVGAASVLLGIFLVFVLNRTISSPLREISTAAGRIATGDLTVNFTLDSRRDEVGVLAGTFRTMLTNLREINGQIREGVNVLASSANEILATTTQVGTGATETAAAVSETTSTVEEVRQTAQLSGQKAKYVSESAQRAAQVSQSGKKAVENAIEGMSRIKDQVESIARNVVHLSEQSQSIAEIASTVADIAGQVNLLSVNASIEASKAGEQGKGFLVVAQEVKSLSAQARQATVQVRSILNEVQKAIGAAVMATEQGSKLAQAGTEQADQAGESIKALSETITESAQAALQVAASSQQQQVGMDQLASAMENIKQASIQNAAGTKQAEAAARNIHGLGVTLKKLVERYKVQA